MVINWIAVPVQSPETKALGESCRAGVELWLPEDHKRALEMLRSRCTGEVQKPRAVASL